MKGKTVLQYLSTASDSFLVVALAFLLGLPIAIGICTQPVRNTSQPTNILKVEQASAPAVTNSLSQVLGASDVRVPTNSLSNVNVSFIQSPDVKKITLDAASATSSEYTATVSVKTAGSYNLMTLTNNNDSSVTLTSQLDILDAKTTQYTLTIAGQKIAFSKGTVIPVVVLAPKSQTVITLSADAKNLGTVKLTAKLS